MLKSPEEIILVIIFWIIILGGAFLLFSFSRKKIETTIAEKKKVTEKGPDVYQIIAEELEQDDIDKGLWTQAEAMSDGNHDKVKSIYIKLRHKQLIKNLWEKNTLSSTKIFIKHLIENQITVRT